MCATCHGPTRSHLTSTPLSIIRPTTISSIPTIPVRVRPQSLVPVWYSARCIERSGGVDAHPGRGGLVGGVDTGHEGGETDGAGVFAGRGGVDGWGEGVGGRISIGMEELTK